MLDPVIASLHGLKCAVAADEVLFRLAILKNAYKANFNPNQPRVPAGSSEGGQWTHVPSWSRDSRVLSDATPDHEWLLGAQYAQGPRRPGIPRPVRINGRWFQPTPAEAARLAAAESEAQAATARVRALDPNWRPTAELYGTVDGLIRSTEGAARQARVRFDELRSGIGGNFGPPLTSPAQRLDGPAWITAYRSAHSRRDLFGNETGLRNDDTVSVAEFDGRSVFGVNSDALTYTGADRVAAQRAVDTLVQNYPYIMRTGNVGQKPNDALYHAEATILLRAAGASGGNLAGRTIIVEVDREMCTSCRLVLPKLGFELGNPTATFIDHIGTRRTMRDGRWLD
jgi:hypothetical protein